MFLFAFENWAARKLMLGSVYGYGYRCEVVGRKDKRTLARVFVVVLSCGVGCKWL